MSQGIFESLEPARSRQTETREAQARPARSRFIVRTSGIGEIRMEGKQGLGFGAIMLEEPTFSFGIVSAGQLPPGNVPMACAVVLKWRRQGQFWIGADMAFVIDASDLNTRLKFTLTFEGVTLRTTNPLQAKVK